MFPLHNFNNDYTIGKWTELNFYIMQEEATINTWRAEQEPQRSQCVSKCGLWSSEETGVICSQHIWRAWHSGWRWSTSVCHSRWDNSFTYQKTRDTMTTSCCTLHIIVAVYRLVLSLLTWWLHERDITVCVCVLEVTKQQSTFEYFWSVLYNWLLVVYIAIDWSVINNHKKSAQKGGLFLVISN